MVYGTSGLTTGKTIGEGARFQSVPRPGLRKRFVNGGTPAVNTNVIAYAPLKILRLRWQSSSLTTPISKRLLVTVLPERLSISTSKTSYELERKLCFIQHLSQN